VCEWGFGFGADRWAANALHTFRRIDASLQEVFWGGRRGQHFLLHLGRCRFYSFFVRAAAEIMRCTGTFDNNTNVNDNNNNNNNGNNK